MSDGQALSQLIRTLQAGGYAFVTPGGGTIAHNRRRRGEQKPGLRDIFGWSLEFSQEDIEPQLFDLAIQAKILAPSEGRWRSLVRVSSVEGRLFAHSAYPPRASDAVFLGPDTYRFARLVVAETRHGGRSVLDIGSGAGVGAILAAARLPQAKVTATDINPAALSLTAANAAANGQLIELELCDGLPSTSQRFDLIIANPPFISGRFGRLYRDGGGDRGMEAPISWALRGAERLQRGGRLLMYTGSPIIDGEDPFRRCLEGAMAERGLRLEYDEIDPDIFGGLLGRSDYEGVERLAAVAVVIRRP
ncbi:class I SAM-dependent methyltransferase [Caulobacter sp. 73W]|uniref:Class I SAM-dependent methyltransferase n=1 Tax=Caulobacter sp. 73W TaxID=3161137 RepID=A0AB39KWL9_9CAUL